MSRHHLHVTLNGERYAALAMLARSCGYRSLPRFVAVLIGLMVDKREPEEIRFEIREMFESLADWERDPKRTFSPNLMKRL